MDSTIIAALIAAGATIAGSIIAAIVATRKQLPSSHSPPTPAEATPPARRQGESEPQARAGRTVAQEELAPVLENVETMTFDEVIEAIRQQYPDATLGRTAEQGPYFERAKQLTNYRFQGADPLRYGAVQTNGKTMWLYLGRGGRICCGDKDW